VNLLVTQLDIIITLVLSGLVLGAIYSLMSIGLTLIYGVTKIFNYAQGSLFTLAGYIAWLLFSNTKLNYASVVLVTLVVMGIFGYIFEKVFVKPVRRLKNWEFIVIIVTLGCALLFDNLYLIIFNPMSKTIPLAAQGTLKIGNIAIAWHDLLVLFISFGSIFLLDLFLKKTSVGLAMRAVSQDITGAKIVGLRLNVIFGYSFALACVLAALAALMLVPDIMLYPQVGWTVLMKAMVVIVLGGLGSIKGTLYATKTTVFRYLIVNFFNVINPNSI
jgi:branched-chain amino acid transport system permease protein